LQAVSSPFCFSLTSITCSCGNLLAGQISFHLLHHVEMAFYHSNGGTDRQASSRNFLPT